MTEHDDGQQPEAAAVAALPLEERAAALRAAHERLLDRLASAAG